MLWDALVATLGKQTNELSMTVQILPSSTFSGVAVTLAAAASNFLSNEKKTPQDKTDVTNLKHNTLEVPSRFNDPDLSPALFNLVSTF